jgi:hypothetical protein
MTNTRLQRVKGRSNPPLKDLVLLFIHDFGPKTKEKVIMASEQKAVDYTAIINDLEKKKATLEATIAALKAFQAVGAMAPMIGGIDLLATAGGPGTADLGAGEELPKGALLGKSFPAAIKLYLSAMKKKQTIKELATALQEQGMESTAASFESVVTGALNRLKNSGEVLRFKEGWGLSSWYPEAFRARLSGEPKTRKSTKKKRATKAPSKTVEQTERMDEPKEGLEWRIRASLDLASGGLSPAQIAKQLEFSQGAISLALGRMAKKGLAIKDVHGLYHHSRKRVSLVPESA